MFIEPTITRVRSGFSGYIWLDTKIVLKKFSSYRVDFGVMFHKIYFCIMVFDNELLFCLNKDHVKWGPC